jgi:hypothetical protein
MARACVMFAAWIWVMRPTQCCHAVKTKSQQLLRRKNVLFIKARLVRAFLFQMEHAKYPMKINEIIHRLSTFEAQVRIKGSTSVTTQIQAANLAQARLLLQHLYGAANIVSLVVASA